MTARIVSKREKMAVTFGYLVALAVAGVSAWSSWGHIDAVSREAGEAAHAWIAVSVDGMMVAGATMSYVDKLRGFKSRGWATVALWLGSLMTVAFNVASAIDRGLGSIAVAVVPAIALIVTVEAVFKPSRRLLAMVTDAIATVAQQAAPQMPVAASVVAVEPAAPVQAPSTVPTVGGLSPAALDGLAATAARPPRKRAPRKAVTVDTSPEIALPARSGEAATVATVS